MDGLWSVTTIMGHSSSFRMQHADTLSSENWPRAKLSHPIERAASASDCQACPMSCKQYRYARSRYFQASRHAMLVRTKTRGAVVSVSLLTKSPIARCSAMWDEGR